MSLMPSVLMCVLDKGLSMNLSRKNVMLHCIMLMVSSVANTFCNRGLLESFRGSRNILCYGRALDPHCSHIHPFYGSPYCNASGCLTSTYSNSIAEQSSTSMP